MSDAPVAIGAKVAPEIENLFRRPEVIEGDVYDGIEPKLEPYKHQRRAVNDAVRNLKEHGYHALFMEMGTGKTKSTIDTFMSLYKDGVVSSLVIVAPKALISTWRDEELPKHLSLPVSVFTWDGRKSEKARREFADFVAAEGPVAYLVNVEAFQTIPDLMRDQFHTLTKTRPSLLVVDESSFIKSPDAARSKALVGAGRLARARMILTGTEITNSPLDLYMQFNFLCPGFWGVKSFFIFRARYAQLEEAYGAGQRTFKKVVGYQRLGELMGRIAPFTTRALKDECLDLPEKLRITLHVDLTPNQKRVYDSLKKNLAALIGEDKVLTVPNKIALFTKFRQIPGGTIKVEGEHEVLEEMPPKLEMLLSDVQGTDEQAIIWCSFNHEIELIVQALKKIAPAAPYHGGVPDEMREAYKRQFQKGEIRFLVMNAAAGSFGLNLQNCHIQYTYSRHLSPDKVWQGEDRTHRLGQREVCVYKTLVARGTVDERIESILKQKSLIREGFQKGTIKDEFNIKDMEGDMVAVEKMSIEEMLKMVEGGEA